MSYSRYRLSGTELLKCAALYMAGACVIAYIFYDSMIALAVLVPGFPVYMSAYRKELCHKRQDILKGQFIEMISSLSAALTAGMSVENAFAEVGSDMVRLYGDEAYITAEVNEFIKKSEVGIPVADSLADFAERSGIEDIRDFAGVFTEALKSGGNLRVIIGDTSHIIREKLRIEDEIKAVLKGKQLEQRVMSVIPFLMIGYMRVTSSDFISVLYHNIPGITVMSICLIVYVAAFVLSARIVDIRI